MMAVVGEFLLVASRSEQIHGCRLRPSGGLKVSRGFREVVSVNGGLVSINPAVMHLVKLPKNYDSADYAGDRQYYSEESDATGPSRHHTLIQIMLGWSLLAATYGAVLLAFKGSEYADDRRPSLWLLPLSCCAAFASLAAYQGIGLISA